MFGKEKKIDLEVYALYDSKTMQYNLPSYFMNEHEARRFAERMLKDPKQAESLVNTNPEDFSLFKIGTYDRFTGQIAGMSPAQHILHMHELKAFLDKQPN